MAEKTRVIIVDDHDAVVEGLRGAIAELPGFEVVGSANDGVKAIELVRSLQPDIVVMDISMPQMSGLEAAKELKRLNEEIRIVIFSSYSDAEYVLPLKKAGISAYVLKENPLSDLIMALKAVKGNDTYWSVPVREGLLPPTLPLPHEKDYAP